MNANQQLDHGGVLTPGDSGTGAGNGAPCGYFFISFAAEGAIVGIPVGQSAAITIPSGALAAGMVHPIAFSRIKTGTAATGLMWWT